MTKYKNKCRKQIFMKMDILGPLEVVCQLPQPFQPIVARLTFGIRRLLPGAKAIYLRLADKSHVDGNTM